MEKQGYREALELLVERYPNRATLTVKETAETMGIPLNTVYDSINRVRNPLPSKRLGRKIVIPIPALARWMAG